MKFFKQYFSKKAITEGVKESRFSALTKYLGTPSIWHMDCHSLARGVAIGLFAGILPIIPFQTALTILMCFVFSGNLPIAFLVSWICFMTYGPFVYVNWVIGKWILGTRSHEVGDYLLGLLIISVVIPAIGYITTVLIYKLSNYFQERYHKRKH